MPTKPSRARRWVKEGKAVGKWSDLGVYYVQLTEPSSAEEVQPITVGVDPGKSYSGVGVQSAKCTLLQLHLILPFGRVKKRMETRAMLRRSRRGRRINRDVPFKQRNHRQCRFDNRKQCKLPPSIKASRQLELRTVTELAAIFPVTAIGYERVRADVDQTQRKRAKSGKGFSPVMTGQQLGNIPNGKNRPSTRLRRERSVERSGYHPCLCPARLAKGWKRHIPTPNPTRAGEG
ncbi:MAG: RRXRR domain-containing protein [Coleofasciculus sp. E1-EBD-02]